nr:two-component sensor histidine kinase [Zoogloea sp.]
WLTALGSALLLYGTLFGLIRRADRTIKRQHARLLNAEMLAVVGELTSSVAHNIRNPLSSIRACAELTLESPGEDCSDEARDIIAQVDRISGCITELLTYAGTGSGMGGQVDLASLLGECASQSEATFARRRQRIAVDCGAGLFLVRGETSLFRQVILSLIANASEAMGEGGDCVLRLSVPDGRHLQVDIIDSGPGIPPDVMGQVFRPFFTTKPKGLGLGLPLAKRIIERFDGAIRVLSRPEGGTTVTLLFSRA